MYPPTYHPGLYDKPQQTPFLDFGNLFKLLFRPQEAFEDLYDHTSATQGFTLAIIFIALSSALGLIANLVFLGQWDLPEDAGVTGFTSSSAASSVIGIFTGIIFFWITAWMFHALVKDKGRNASLDKTIGMMGYAKFPAFIVMVLIAVLTPLTLIGSLADLEDNPDQAIGAVCGTLALIFGLGIIGICWSFWVHSHAQSVANDLSTSTAFGYLLLTWFLVFLIEAAVTFVLLFVIVGTAFGV
jgi:hypothetical protein